MDSVPAAHIIRDKLAAAPADGSNAYTLAGFERLTSVGGVVDQAKDVDGMRAGDVLYFKQYWMEQTQGTVSQSVYFNLKDMLPLVPGQM